MVERLKHRPETGQFSGNVRGVHRFGQVAAPAALFSSWWLVGANTGIVGMVLMGGRYTRRLVAISWLGAIVNVAKVDPMPKTVGQWNTYEITAKGDTFTVVLNGKQTVVGKDAKHPKGHIGLQHGLGNKDAAGVVNDKGVVKFRKVEIKTL